MLKHLHKLKSAGIAFIFSILTCGASASETATEGANAASTPASILLNKDNINMGTCGTAETLTSTVTATTTNLTTGITINISGASASMFGAKLTDFEANVKKLTVTFTPTKAGTHTATITLTSGSAKATLNVTATATNASAGSGTESAPYSIEHIASLTAALTGDRWVKGTIAGYYQNGEVNNDNPQDTYLALQDAGSDAIIPIQLTGSLMSEYGVKSNPENIGRVIKVKGSVARILNTIGISAASEIKFVTGVLSISSSQWATYYTDKAFIMPANATGYIVLPDGSNSNTVSPEKTYTEGDVVPAKTPIIVNGEAGDYTYYTTTTTATSDTRNMLRGQLKAGMITPEANGNYLYYKLSYNSDGEALGFYWGAENGGVFSLKGNNRAYLVVPKSTSNAKSIRVIMPGDDIAGIGDVTVTKENDSAIYNLAGQRVGKSAKGICIKNGKKFLVK